MKKFLKWTAISIGSLILLIIVFVGATVMMMNGRLTKTYNIQPERVALQSDEVSLENGQRLAYMHCAGCHGENFGGTTMLKDDAIGIVNSANLTSGKGGKVRHYTNDDWVRSIRHGVDPKGRPLLIMPSREFYYLNDKDLADIVSYLKTVSPVDNEMSGYDITILTKILATFGAFGPFINAEVVNHDGQRLPSVEPGETVEYGHYMVRTSGCYVCHGESLKGGKDPQPQAPPVPNITRTGHFGKWTVEQFMETLKTGKTPEGKQLSIFMPWKNFSRMNETELKAIYKYLRTV